MPSKPLEKLSGFQPRNLLPECPHKTSMQISARLRDKPSVRLNSGPEWDPSMLPLFNMESKLPFSSWNRSLLPIKESQFRANRSSTGRPCVNPSFPPPQQEEKWRCLLFRSHFTRNSPYRKVLSSTSSALLTAASLFLLKWLFDCTCASQTQLFAELMNVFWTKGTMWPWFLFQWWFPRAQLEPQLTTSYPSQTCQYNSVVQLTACLWLFPFHLTIHINPKL